MLKRDPFRLAAAWLALIPAALGAPDADQLEV